MAGSFRDYGLEFTSVPSFETLRYESPINLTSGNHFSGEACSIGAFTYIQPQGEFTRTSIGRYCSIAGQVCVGPGQHHTHLLSTHPFDCDPTDVAARLGHFPSYRKILSTRPFSVPDGASSKLVAPDVKIGHDVWIGMRVIIMGGLTIGDGAIIAAGAVVTKNVEPYTIVAGVPARVVRKRFPLAIIDQLMVLQWWDYDMSQVSNQVDFGKVEEVIAFMNARIQANSLPKFAPETYLAKRTGTSYSIAPAPPAA